MSLGVPGHCYWEVDVLCASMARTDSARLLTTCVLTHSAPLCKARLRRTISY